VNYIEKYSQKIPPLAPTSTQMSLSDIKGNVLCTAVVDKCKSSPSRNDGDQLLRGPLLNIGDNEVQDTFSWKNSLFVTNYTLLTAVSLIIVSSVAVLMAHDAIFLGNCKNKIFYRNAGKLIAQ
jgi:hypothetical protein